jgi:pimeloyl-ACP methyl ester carboxylesterase
LEHFSNDGFGFDVTDTPAGGDVAILLHGFPEDRHCWDAVTPALVAAGHRVLAPSLRGYSPGARPRARRAYTLSNLAGDVLALADQAGARRFHLVGHDWGAGLAWYVAGRHPERTISLAALSVPHPEAYGRALRSSSQLLRSWYMMAFQTPGLPERLLASRHGETMRRGLIRNGLDPATAARYATRSGDMRGPLNWYRALPYGLRDRTGRIEVPTLFVWSDRDPFIARRAAALCGEHVAAPYRFEILHGASHWLPTERPDRIAALLAEHFAAA